MGGQSPMGARGPMGGPGLLGGPGGESGTTGAELVALLQDTGTKWSAATTGAQSGAQLQLDSGTSVISIGGFGGSDPAPTLEEFQAMVTAGKVRYYVEGDTPGGGGPSGGGGPGGFGSGGRSGSEIAQWVMANFTPTTVSGHTVYDLASPVG